jgi:hypothetical protein
MIKFASATLFLLLFSTLAVARQVPDFSGTYFLKSTERSDSRSGSVVRNVFGGRVITKVVQDRNSVEIVFRSKTGLVTYKYGLDGSEIQGTEEDGTPTLERAEIKGKNLIIRSQMTAAKGITLHRTQWWELSKHLKILTVHEQLQTQGMHVVDGLQTAEYFRQ